MEKTIKRLVEKGSIPKGFVSTGVNQYGGIFCIFIQDISELPAESYTDGTIYLFYLDGTVDSVRKEDMVYPEPKKVSDSFNYWIKNL